MIVAIDGPSAAGKGTLARRLADRFGWAHLDTGSLYRAVALRVLRDGADPDDAAAGAGAAARLTMADLADPALRAPATAAAASRVAAHPSVRSALLHFQRDFAAYPPDGAAGVVMDGRDIGTVVLPAADVKLFVTAAPEERARRRHREQTRTGEQRSLAETRKAIDERDRRDAGRATAPLRTAPDAVLLDTTELDIDAAFKVAIAAISGASPEVLHPIRPAPFIRRRAGRGCGCA